MALSIQIDITDQNQMTFKATQALPPAQMIALLLEVAKSMVMAIPTQESTEKQSQILVPTARDMRAVNGRVHAKP